MGADPQLFYPGVHRRVRKFVLLLALALSASGCSLLKSTLELPEKGIRSLLSHKQENGALDPVELQSQLLRFADNYVDAVNLATGKLRQQDGQPTQRRNVLMRRIAITNDVLGHRHRNQRLC